MTKWKEIWQVTWHFLEGGSLSDTKGLDISKRVVKTGFLLKAQYSTTRVPKREALYRLIDHLLCLHASY